MADHKLKITMSQNGRSSRDQHHVSFRVREQGTFSAAAARTMSAAVIDVLSDATFDSTSFLRATMVELDSNDKAVAGTGITLPSNVTGSVNYATGDGNANEDICLILEKSAGGGKSGLTQFRHCISALEYAAYLNAGTVPARFSVGTGVNGPSGGTLGHNLLAAFNDNDFDLLLPPVKHLLLDTVRVVDTIAAQDFRSIKAKKRRKSAERQAADAAQRRIDELWRQAKKLYDAFTGGAHPADVISTLASLASAALAIYNALPVQQKAMIVFRIFPVLA